MRIVPARSARRIITLLALTGAGVLATATAAFAHAVLVSSNPADGATLTTPPATVSLTFSENVRAPAFVVVTGPGGTSVDGSAPQILNRTVTKRLRAASATGAYTIAYRVVSADGHPIEGEFRYRLAQAATTTTPTPAPAPAAAATTPAPAAASTTRAAAAASTTPAGGGDDGHLVDVLGGLAVVLAGVAALVYERFQRRRHPEDSGASS